jgi:hypothetical protein
LQGATTVQEPECPAESAERESSAPDSSARPRSGEDQNAVDASERARLITDIGRLIRGPTVPETTRLAGLTLIGWLARRLPEEPAHAVGVEEARQSRRRLQAARAKAR